MAEVFHVAERPDVDRASHQPGAVLENVEPSPTSYPGALEAIRQRFPHGVSKHGAQYLRAWPHGELQAGFAAEALCEAVRLAEYPEKPSRMTSWFAAESIEDARAFVAVHRTQVFVDIWRAEGEILHRGNMALLQCIGLPVIAALEQMSAYWRGEGGIAPVVWEVLVGPGLTLVEVVETTGQRVSGP
jgi:uncharacterized protein DUF2441